MSLQISVASSSVSHSRERKFNVYVRVSACGVRPRALKALSIFRLFIIIVRRCGGCVWDDDLLDVARGSRMEYCFVIYV